MLPPFCYETSLRAARRWMSYSTGYANMGGGSQADGRRTSHPPIQPYQPPPQQQRPRPGYAASSVGVISVFFVNP